MVTPFKKNEDIDIDACKSNVDYYIENRIHGIVVAGSTGEFASLSPDEHRRMISLVTDQVNGRVPIVAGTSCCSTRNTIEMSKYAEDVGVDAVLVVPPFYTPLADEEAYTHYAMLSRELNIPIMLYNNPFTSKFDMKPELVQRLSKLSNITHIKESSGDISRIWRIRQLTNESITVFCGADNLALESFAMGAKGWVSVAANILPEECAELFELVSLKNDFEKAKILYNKLLPLCNLLESTGKFVGLSKTGLGLLGLGNGMPRKPLSPPSRKDTAKLTAILRTFQKL